MNPPIDFVGIFESFVALLSHYTVNVKALSQLVPVVAKTIADGQAAVAAVQSALKTADQPSIDAAVAKVQAEIADLQAATTALLSVVTPAGTEKATS